LTSPNILIPKKRVRIMSRRAIEREKQAQVTPQEHPGRPSRCLAGGFIDDHVAQLLAIVLCWSCQHKFDHKAHNYYKDRRFPFVQGKCDDCARFQPRCAFYIHESFLGEANGRIKSGQCWTPV
jgi:hypothetical protein